MISTVKTPILAKEKEVERVKVVKAVVREETTLEVAKKAVKGIHHQRTIHQNQLPNSPLRSWEMVEHPTGKRFK